MVKIDEGLLFKLHYVVRFFDADWTELEYLRCTATQLEIPMTLIERWRHNVAERMLQKQTTWSEYDTVVCVGIEVKHG